MGVLTWRCRPYPSPGRKKNSLLPTTLGRRIEDLLRAFVCQVGGEGSLASHPLSTVACLFLPIKPCLGRGGTRFPTTFQRHQFKFLRHVSLCFCQVAPPPLRLTNTWDVELGGCGGMTANFPRDEQLIRLYLGRL